MIRHLAGFDARYLRFKFAIWRRTNYDDIVIQYYVYTPVTGKIRVQGHMYYQARDVGPAWRSSGHRQSTPPAFSFPGGIHAGACWA